MKVMIEYEDVQSQSPIDAYRVLTNECNHPGATRWATLGEDESESELQLGVILGRDLNSSYKANCAVYSTRNTKFHCPVSTEVNNRATHIIYSI
jgi:hypothetical protein